MHTHNEIKNTFAYRFSEKALPLFVWLTILMPLWLSPFHPAVAAYLILAYFLYFLYKALKTVYYGIVSLKLMQRASATDWEELMKHEPDRRNLEHYILIVTSRESTEKLMKTLDNIAAQKYDLKKVHVFLGMEAREGEAAKERSAALHSMYKDTFASMHSTFHEITPEEAVGKASNATYAARRISEDARKRGIKPENVLVTVCDADSLLPDQYLSYFTYKFIHEENRQYLFFAAPVLLYNHFWKLPFPVRMQMILSSAARLAYLSQRDDLIQISTYSTNLWLIESVGYWDVDIIPEDWHIWLQAFYTLGEKVKTIPIYIPIVRDGVLGPTLRKTFKIRYEQEKRWAWGATDIPYAVSRFFTSPHIPFAVKLRRILFVMEVHFLWPTAFFVLTVSASLPALVNPVFGRTVLGLLLPKIASFILTCSTILLLVSVYFDFKLRKKVNIETSWQQVPMLFIQWFFLPFVSFLFSSLPALEAHTRMLLGKKMEYHITEKI